MIFVFPLMSYFQYPQRYLNGTFILETFFERSFYLDIARDQEC